MDEIQWKEVIKLPFPEWILAVFWQVMIRFWWVDVFPERYTGTSLPLTIDDVRILVDNRMRDKVRYHVYTLKPDEVAGILDESPFWIDITRSTDAIRFLEHGDYRHSQQLFLRSFLQAIRTRNEPELREIRKIIRKCPCLSWKCPVCKRYRKWSMDFIESEFLTHGVSVSPSTLLFLLSRDNLGLREIPAPVSVIGEREYRSMISVMETALHRFFVEFEKIYNQTSVDPSRILARLIEILLRFMKGRNIEEIGAVEDACAREMRSYILSQFKYIKTKTIAIAGFPRSMMIIREIFVSIVDYWKSESVLNKNPSESPGVFLLLSYMMFPDRALVRSIRETDLLVLHSNVSDGAPPPVIRYMTPPEITEFTDYHPLLRPFAYMSSPDDAPIVAV